MLRPEGRPADLTQSGLGEAWVMRRGPLPIQGEGHEHAGAGDRRSRALGVRPDTLTLSAIPSRLVASACLLLSPTVPVTLLGVPVLASLRLVLNILDGAVARRSGRTHARGELYNEIGDRLTDIAFPSHGVSSQVVSTPDRRRPPSKRTGHFETQVHNETPGRLGSAD